MNTVVIKDDMKLFVLGEVQKQLIHERQEFYSPFLPGSLCVNGSGCDLQRRKEIERAVSFVGTLKTLNNLAVLRCYIARRTCI